MWYFAWILGVGLALAFGIINVMWLEANYAFGRRNEDETNERFASANAKAELARKRPGPAPSSGPGTRPGPGTK
ncbi:cytochrome bd-I oxidase subunit CydX [Herbaspirillum rhizosphaerae]|uniref:Cytochrome bd-I oxidase subunit CydX n=1 Tax=Herbaspirillum rhizosphaerae TaxID=346179 RepID=A0ABW8Z9C6_9BURK